MNWTAIFEANPLKRDAEWVREHWEKNRRGYYLMVYDPATISWMATGIPVKKEPGKSILAKTKSAETAAKLLNQGFLSIGPSIYPYARRLEDFATY